MLRNHLCCRKNLHYVATKRYVPRPASTPYRSATTATDTPPPHPPQRQSLRDSFRRARQNSNFKYWVIGGTGFVAWCTYYGLKSYSKTRLRIELLPPLPTHVTVSRNNDLQQLNNKLQSQRSLLGGEKIRKLLILGSPGSGKTILAHDLGKQLMDSYQPHQYSFPKSQILVFLQADSEQSFLFSLKAFAAQLKIKASELNDAMGKSFHEGDWLEQCNGLFSCIQENLQKHPDWVLVVDNVDVTSPQSVLDLVRDWFSEEERVEKWNRGSLFVVHDGTKKNIFGMGDDHQFVSSGFSYGDAYRLIQEVVNIDRNQPISTSFKNLIERVHCNPLGTLCIAILLRERLAQKIVTSIDETVSALCADIDSKLAHVYQDNAHLGQFVATPSGAKLVAIEAVVAMTINFLLSRDRYLWHGFDLLSTIKPGYPVPQTLLSRHLRNPIFGLPPLTQPGCGFQLPPVKDQQNAAVDLDPKGKAWSNKNLSEYMRKVEEFFTNGWNFIKEIYNLVYGVLPPLPEKPDGLDMFRGCELLQTSVIEPGGEKAISMHPLVYNAARQHFTSATVPNMESEHITQHSSAFSSQPWYKRINKFDEQATLQTLRNSAGHSTTGLEEMTAVLFRYNLGINVSSLFKFEPFADKEEEFWCLQDVDRYRYLQAHVTNVGKSICDDISVTKNDVAGRSVKNALLKHLEYILSNHPAQLLVRDVHIQALQTVATTHMTLFKDFTQSKSILQDTLTMQKSYECSPLEISKTLAKLASVHQSLEDHAGAKTILEEAAEHHEADRRKHGDYTEPYDFGRLLGQLGTVYASLEMKREAKEAIERSLMLKQMKQPDLTDEPKSKQYGADFSSSLTDLGHAYVLLGLPLYGRKILDLALAAQKNILGESHPEVVRTITVLATAHLMQGHNEESKKLRNEAGKLQSQINAQPLY